MFRVMGIFGLGSASRANKLAAIASEEPLKRLRDQLPVQGLMDKYSAALAFVVAAIVTDIAGEKSSVREYAAIGKKVDKDALNRLSAYVAARATHSLLREYPEIVSGASGEIDDVGRQMMSDFYRVTQIMYPISDPTAVAALKTLNEIPTNDDGTVNSARYLSAQTKAVDALLGIGSDENMGSLMERSIALGAILAGLPKFTKDCLDELMRQG